MRKYTQTSVFSILAIALHLQRTVALATPLGRNVMVRMVIIISIHN